MKRILMAVVSAGLLATVACGSSSKTCDDAANAFNACLTKFGIPTESTFAAECKAAVCTGDKQKAIDCIANAQCGADIVSYGNAILACQAGANCQ
jgi:hypothetical protein